MGSHSCPQITGRGTTLAASTLWSLGTATAVGSPLEAMEAWMELGEVPALSDCTGVC